MGFNRAIFNRSPFNIPSSSNAILAKAEGFEIVDCAIGSALDFRGNAKGYERINAVTAGYPGWIKKVVGAETVSELVATGDMYVLAKANGAENADADILLSAEIFPAISGLEEVTTDCALGADIEADIIGAEIIDANTTLSAVIVSPLTSGYEFVDESASLENIDVKTCYLTVTLRPGQVLIIDANTYNVLLNGQNAIEIQSGDWIDELNRNTVDLKIEAASGSANLDATILYTERYL